MQEQISQRIENFEHIKQPKENELIARNIGEIALNLANVSIDLSNVKRLPRYDRESHENDAEHSFMLGLIAQEVAALHFPELDMGLVVGFSLVHDLPELITGDTVTFKISQKELDKKYRKDHEATNLLCKKLPPYTAKLLCEYEKQQIPEARFVRLLDKLMAPLVDILGEGSMVMHEDREVYSHQDLMEAENELQERFMEMFPEKELEVLHQVKEYLTQEFYKVFKPFNPVKNNLNNYDLLVSRGCR